LPRFRAFFRVAVFKTWGAQTSGHSRQCAFLKKKLETAVIKSLLCDNNT
jgi:hypothetical protein